MSVLADRIHAQQTEFMSRLADDLTELLPAELRDLSDPQTDMPRIAKDRKLTARIESALREVPTHHDLQIGDARLMDLPPESVQLVLTSPPYWTLKEYRDSEGQLGHIDDYDAFLVELDKVWFIRLKRAPCQVGTP
jgi:modification methylase